MSALHHTYRIARAATCAALLSIVATAVQSQETSTFKQQSKLIRPTEETVALGNDLFGDKVSLYTGSLEFVQTDVSLPGNNRLPVAVGRRFKTGTEPINTMLFGNWDLEIPHLHGVFASSGWSAARGTSCKGCTRFCSSNFKRCSKSG
jgi:hypothetical protein